MQFGNQVKFISGGTAVDDRGRLDFINELSLEGFSRFYVVSNHRQGFIRAWHGHRFEGKAVVLLQGSALVCAVEVDNWESPAKDLPISRNVLSLSKFGALWIPPGFANGFMSLTADAQLMFLSTSSLEDSAKDDIRFDAKYWNPWDIEER